jgi:hypothetical protein
MLIGLRLFSSVAALCCVFNGWDLRYWLVLYCLCTLFFNLRGGMGNNGSDQMTSIVLFLACISTVVNSPLVQKYAVITISVQLSLSYLTAGSVKLTSRAWLSGEAMRSIMHSETFGSQRIYRAFLKSNGLAVMTGIAVICTEILCSAAPWSPPKVCLALLGLAAISHIAIAVTMGLNTFVPAFLAAFPSAMFVSTALWVRA